MNISENLHQIKDVIKQGISQEIDFAELRSRLPGIRKRLLQSLIFDVMAELGMKQLPFAGMIPRPRLTRKPIPVQEDGTLNIMDVLKEKEFDTKICAARVFVGNDKITLTIKPVKNQPEKVEPNSDNSSKTADNVEEEFERMDFSNY